MCHLTNCRGQVINIFVSQLIVAAILATIVKGQVSDFTVAAPHFGNTDGSVNGKLVHRTAADIDFDDQIGRRVNR